jgi:hypothetical protein
MAVTALASWRIESVMAKPEKRRWYGGGNAA